MFFPAVGGDVASFRVTARPTYLDRVLAYRVDAVSEERVSGSGCVAPEDVRVEEFPDEALAIGVDGAGEA